MKRKKLRFACRPVPPSPDFKVDVSSIEESPLYDAAVSIAKDRTQKLRYLRTALLNEDIPAVIRYASQLCGLGDCDEESNPANKSFN